MTTKADRAHFVMLMSAVIYHRYAELNAPADRRRRLILRAVDDATHLASTVLHQQEVFGKQGSPNKEKG